jgi:hypothetical protein
MGIAQKKLAVKKRCISGLKIFGFVKIRGLALIVVVTI